jgi:hypothetical protein
MATTNNTSTTTCPDGYFQDDLFHNPSPNDNLSCQPWNSYWAAAIILMVSRIILLVINLIILKRLDDDYYRTNGKRRGMSWTPILETLYTITLCCCLGLASTLNARNGSSWFFFSLTFYFICLSTLFFTAKMTKTARFAAAMILPSRRLTHIRDDPILTIVFGGFHLCILSMLIAWFLGGSVYPGSYTCNKIAEVFVSFYGVFVQFVCIFQLGHAHRIIYQHVHQSRIDVSSHTSSSMNVPSSTPTATNRKFEQVARKLKISMYGMIPLVIMLGTVCILIVIDVIHFYWEVVMVIHYILVLHGILGLQNFWRKRKTNNDNTNNNNNNDHHNNNKTVAGGGRGQIGTIASGAQQGIQSIGDGGGGVVS